MHAERGLIDASKFVPLAEEAGLVFRLDDRIVASAVEARANLTAAGVDPRFRIWCNVSSGQLTREHPTERLATFLTAAGCDASQIGIEITETAILPDVAAAAREIATAREARDQGRARRLRNGPLVAHALAVVADRPGQDRPDVRTRADA